MKNEKKREKTSVSRETLYIRWWIYEVKGVDICKKHRAIGEKDVWKQKDNKIALKKHGATQLISENIEICKKLSENRKGST